VQLRHGALQRSVGSRIQRRRANRPRRSIRPPQPRFWLARIPLRLRPSGETVRFAAQRTGCSAAWHRPPTVA